MSEYFSTSRDIHELRELSRDYPRELIGKAIDAALASLETDVEVRSGFAMMVAAWLSDPTAIDDPPPLPAGVVTLIRRALRARIN